MKRWWIVLAVLALGACSTQTAATPTASPVEHDYGTPPAGVSLVYVTDPRHAGWYVGVDWTGKPRGTVKLAQPLVPPQTLVQSPDGSAFLIPWFKGSTMGFLDRLGTPVADPDVQRPELMRMIWADDSTHLCTLEFSGGINGRWLLGLKTPGTPAVTHPVALDPTIVRSGIIAIEVRSCSPENDRAVLVYNYIGRPTDVYVVRISDGAVVLRQSHPANVLADVTASADGALIAENSGKSSGYLMGPTAPETIVRRVFDGSIAVKLDPSFFVVAFSRDNSLALVSTSPLASGAPTNLALVRLSDGTVLWRRDSSEEWGGRWVRPDGNDIAFQLGPPAGPVTGPIELVIVHPNGTDTAHRF